MKYVLGLFIMVLPIGSWAYPDFISYGYNTCISCHTNSHGNGPLTEYGRALFSQEIAARNFWTPKSKTDEEVAEDSGFIPGVKMPFWISPSIKFRGLYVQSNPGSGSRDSRWIRMQRDFNLVLSADEASRTVLVYNYGLLHLQDIDYYNDGKPVDGVSREHYIRFFPFKELMFAAGLMDIAYGLRTGDHTSLARGRIGFGQDDQVHGVMLQLFKGTYEATLHAFAGNLYRKENARKEGASVQFEYMLSEKDKVGFSLYQAKTPTITSQRLAIHNRLGLANSPGDSILAELGFTKDETEGVGSQDGMYGMVQSIIHLTRGYNILTTIEKAQRGSGSSDSESSRWTFGFLMFPLQRTEVRLTMVQGQSYSQATSSAESLQFQGQIHVSF